MTVSPQPTPGSIERVLVVDYNADFAGLIADELSERYDVRTTHDGAAALELVSTFAPDLVLTDIALPGFSGWELARRIRKLDLPRRPFLLAMSAMDMEPHRARSTRVGFELHIGKPFRIDYLHALIAQLGTRSG